MTLSLLQCTIAKSKGFACEKTSLGIHAMEDLAISIGQYDDKRLTILKPWPSLPIKESAGIL